MFGAQAFCIKTRFLPYTNAIASPFLSSSLSSPTSTTAFARYPPSRQSLGDEHNLSQGFAGATTSALLQHTLDTPPVLETEKIVGLVRLVLPHPFHANQWLTLSPLLDSWLPLSSSSLPRPPSS